MSTDATLLQLALELAASYDADLDTARGSAFRTKFLDPLLTRVGGSPLDVDTETFLVERVRSELPDVDVSPFSAIRDLVIRAFKVMGDPYKREINGIKQAQSLNNYEVMTREEVDALLGNYFTRLRSGSLSVGTVRMYFPTAQSVIVSPTTQFSTGGSLNFYPSVVQSISNTQMSFQQSGELYYFDVQVQAEAPGPEYDVAPNSITKVAGISGITRVTNLRKLRGGISEETKAEGVARTQNSIANRNLITARGAAFVLPQDFPAVDTLQIIGHGDPEMLRDVISGPVSISGIPGGISGRNPVDISFGQFVHIGGMTDIFVYQPEPNLEDIDIENLTDKGFRVYSGLAGFTAAGVPTSTFEDSYGFFQTRGVQPGDMLLVGADSYEIAAVLSETSLDLSPSLLNGGQYGLTYEIMRTGSGIGHVYVPLYDLVALGADGAAVFTETGAPASPVPGDFARAALLDAFGDPIAKTENRASENVQLPLLRVSSVEFLDPLTLEASGILVPMKDLLVAAAPEGITGGTGSVKAAGTVRLYFRDAVNCYVTRASTTFTSSGRTYRPLEEFVGASGRAAGVPDEGVNEITIAGDHTSSIAIGDRFEFTSAAPGVHFTVLNTAYNSGDGETLLTVRETLSDVFGSPLGATTAWAVHVGILEANMSQDSETGLYYFDVDVEDFLVGSGGNRAVGTTFSATSVTSEGWSLKTTTPVLSYSVRELPYLDLTVWVNDTTQLFVTFTAPALRVSYEYAGDLVDIQRFVEDPQNRVVSEDVLIRHFIPSYVRTQMSVADIDTDTSKTTVVAYINALDPTDALEVSDLSAELSRVGSKHIVMPVTLVGLTQNRDRSWSGLISQDSLGSSRIQHFVADQDFVVTTLAT